MKNKQEKQIILVVDDSPENIDVLNGLLEQHYQIKAAVRGEKALKIAATKPAPNLILLDIMMPYMDGYEVCRRLKSKPETRDIPVIFVTAKNQIKDEEKGFVLGAVDYITKPIIPSIVLARVKTQLELVKSRQELEKQNMVLQENILLREDVERMTQHDLKSPLSAVINIPKLLISEKNISDEQMEMLKMVEESGYRMLDIINGSLDLYKMESGKYKVSAVPVNVIDIVRQIHGETRELVRKKNIKILIILNGQPVRETDVFSVNGEKMLCYSMLANLIKNAVEASPENKSIRISFDEREGRQISIHNKGMVPESMKERFFEKYATAGKEEGTGLGTYTAKLIAETLGGSISFESLKKIGTVVSIILPRFSLAGDADLSLKSGKTSVPSFAEVVNKLTPLVVDDYQPMRQTIIGILKEMGFKKIFGANDGADALQVLDDEQIDLVISDLNMPNLNGFELLRNIRSIPAWYNTPFILVTGDSELQTVALAAKTKVNEFIIKPFSADILKKKIKNVLSQVVD
jgi:two-component system, sensor histidine kinase and response regulator